MENPSISLSNTVALDNYGVNFCYFKSILPQNKTVAQKELHESFKWLVLLKSERFMTLSTFRFVLLLDF